MYKYTYMHMYINDHVDVDMCKYTCTVLTSDAILLLKTGCKLSHNSCTVSHSCNTSVIVASLPAHCAVSFLSGCMCGDESINTSVV